MLNPRAIGTDMKLLLLLLLQESPQEILITRWWLSFRRPAGLLAESPPLTPSLPNKTRYSTPYRLDAEAETAGYRRGNRVAHGKNDLQSKQR